MEGNVDKTLAAPWVVIIAHDLEFHEKIPDLFPHNPGAKEWFADEENRHLDRVSKRYVARRLFNAWRRAR